LDTLIFEPGAFYIMDRGYIDWGRLYQISSAGAFFVIRAKDNLRFTRYKSQSVDKATGLRSDQIGKLSIPKSRGDFPTFLRKVHFYDEEKKKHLIFLTNNLQITAWTVAKLYKKRWEIELFFKWIKGNLEIKHYYGTSPNAVKTQIWIAVSLYLMVAILHKSLKLPGSLRNTLQILSVHPFEKMPLNELLIKTASQNLNGQNSNQLELFDL
jgi:IS4 transposase